MPRKIERVMTTWALIANGTWARIVKNDGRAHAWAAIDGMTFGSVGEFDATKDVKRGKPISTLDAAGLAREIGAPQNAPLRTLKTLFAQQLSETLSVGLELGAYERLIIAAPPKMLRDLKLCLSDKVTSRIAGESSRDLTNVPVGDLGGHLGRMQLD